MKERCYSCGRVLQPGKEVWLELSCYTGEFQPAGSEPLPEEESQGYFPFGAECAAKVKKPTYVECSYY